MEDIYLSALLIPPLIYTPETQSTGDNNGFIYLFHNNPFNTTGLITSWVFAAQKLNSSTTLASQFPQLQIWRSMSDGTCYGLQFTTMTKSWLPTLLGTLNMYTHELDPPISYEPNDIIGIYQPSDANAALQIAFVNSNNTMLQALVEPVTLASTGTFTNAGRIPTTVLPLMSLATKIAVEPSQTHSSIISVGQLSIMSSMDQSRSTMSHSIPVSLQSVT